MMKAQSRGAACAVCCECGHPDCATGLAERALTRDDWYLIGFYRRVCDQWDNKAPFGSKDGKPVAALRLESIEATLRVYRYRRDLWPWLVGGARTLYSLANGTDRAGRAEYVQVYGKMPHELIPEETRPCP